MNPEKKPRVWDEIERGLSSAGKLKILYVMSEKANEAFTKYGLEKATGLKPVDVRTNLRTLVKLGWIKEYVYQPRTYKINLENAIIKHISKFFQEIQYL